MKEALMETINEVTTTLLTTRLAKLEATVEGFPTVKVVAYWVGDLIRIDVKGAKA